MQKQVVVIHGGDVFKTHEDYVEFLKRRLVNFERHALRQLDFQENLQSHLGEGFQVIRPSMPSMVNAKYEEWKIWFEKFFQFLQDEVILVGSSLGAVFLAKYLAENTFPKKVKALFLIAGPFGDNMPEYKLLDYSLPQSLEKLESQPEKIFLYHSKDDPVVPFADLAKYQQALPKAATRVFEDRGHFFQPDLPELTADINNL